ncbi:single-stranded DNA-binding protein [Candidatus Wolfebacteria bacterium CG02_land_8_20_14_3_00_37_12]|uniref:Single-stranded DNA-binding protein n=3 Tax=Candidatus Wolfeibacteriota TaxID=1752735 RepID=A0A2M7Q761_9BACT|nr:MAG: single-stranded DNA-binding protein [Candidatus Wolfebacteria bacterium CG02_land_8_20_14_3_00_37_12]PIY59267.1 MAG: single-stranded DNA-binding protein [Candidatus Wolfebacteria bacterium CG_4_10_14_0_8_um_filter_37_11]PJA41680.1 MAG: single-stranded DNA-binding protein [Candidatus Wolfebacteria bacterium CG_4_9_14_3_um_filter_37_9]
MNLNKVFIIGNLTRDPELRSLPSGAAVVNFSIATNRVWKDQQGQKQEQVEFHNIVSFGRQAELINQYLKKGSMVLIEGRLQTRNWEKDGVKHYRTEIVAESVQFGPKSSGGGFKQNSNSAPIKEEVKEELPEINIDEGDIKAEDLPF